MLKNKFNGGIKSMDGSWFRSAKGMNYYEKDGSCLIGENDYPVRITKEILVSFLSRLERIIQNSILLWCDIFVNQEVLWIRREKNLFIIIVGGYLIHNSNWFYKSVKMSSQGIKMQITEIKSVEIPVYSSCHTKCLEEFE